MGIKSLNLALPDRAIYDFVEDENECPGGHYSVTLDEVFQGQKKKYNGEKTKYQVMLNLHFGDKSTVWVCHDDDREINYWALKILSVDASKNTREHLTEDYVKNPLDRLKEEEQRYQLKKAICLLVDKFLVRGPKGNHQCFVYPLLGPQAQPGWMSELYKILRDRDGFSPRNGLSPSDYKSFSRTYYQLANAVRFIHSQQLCHGRIIPSNVLHCIQGLDGKRVNDVCAILLGGKKRAMAMVDQTREQSRGPVKRIHKGAGDWKSRSVYWDAPLVLKYLTSDIALIGFGQCFPQSSPPSTLDIPVSYQPPELMLKGILGPGTDLWALGCTLYELRMGFPLLDFGSTDRIEQLQCIVKTLEPLGGNVKDLESYGCTDLNISRLNESKVVPALSEQLEKRTVTFLFDNPPIPCERAVMRRSTERIAFRILLRKLLKYDYEKRKGAEAIIKDDWVRKQRFLPKRPSRRRYRFQDA